MVSPLPLNRALLGLHDGALVASVELQHWDGVKRHLGRVRVYWPFVVFRCTHNAYNITHALSGYHVQDVRRLGEAVSLIVKLRACADWNFRSGQSKKARAACRSAKHLVRPLVQVT